MAHQGARRWPLDYWAIINQVGPRVSSTRAEATEAWMHIGRALAASDDPGDRELARSIAHFVQAMPSTRRTAEPGKTASVESQSKRRDIDLLR